MATNMIFNDVRGIPLTVASTVTSEMPVMKGNLPGVAVTDYDATSGKATIDFRGAYDLSVAATNDGGNTTVAVGDAIYFDDNTTPKLSRKTSGKLYGFAMEAITTVGGTATIQVLLADFGTDNAVSGGRYTYEPFETSPIASLVAGGAPQGTTGTVNLMSFENNIFEYCIKGTQTILSPAFSADGLDIGMDQTANDGIEITQGITARSKAAFVVGTDAFYMKMRYTIADVSGTDDCAIGFRKAEAYQANIDDFADMAVLNTISGTITIETIVGGAATTVTSTTNTWADAATKSLEVYVSKAGAVTYKIDGAAPTATAAYSFTSGLTVLPFMFFLNDTDLAGAVNIKSWEVGLQ